MPAGADAPGRLTVPTALVVAHPGHELRVHGWLERARPAVCVLTDGSGGAGASRLNSTLRVLAATGARRGPVFGRFADRDVYAHLLGRRLSPWLRLVDHLADFLARERVRLVACDAAEGYNPAHDLCRLVTEVAARRAGGVAVYDFPLVGPPRCSSHPGKTIRLRLDDQALARKLAAARDYPELAGEIESAIRAHGVEALRHEWLTRGDSWSDAAIEQPPNYERFGAERVATGRYATVIRYRDHVRPVASTLARLWEREAA
jgi:hypothetical protein